jgi:hypothetical protein
MKPEVPLSFQNLIYLQRFLKGQQNQILLKKAKLGRFAAQGHITMMSRCPVDATSKHLVVVHQIVFGDQFVLVFFQDAQSFVRFADENGHGTATVLAVHERINILDVEFGRHQASEDGSVRLVGVWQQDADDVGFEHREIRKRQQFMRTFVVVYDHAGDGTVGGIQNAERHNPQVIAFYHAEQLVQRSYAVFEEHDKLPQTGPIATSRSLGLDQGIISKS